MLQQAAEIEGKDAPPVQPPRNGRPFRHLTVRSYDPDCKTFYMQSESGETRLGVCFQANPVGGADDGMMQRLRSILSTPLPAGSFLQFGLFSEPDIDYAIEQYLASKVANNELLQRLSTRRAEMLAKGVLEPLPGMNDVPLCRQRVIVSLSIPCSAMPSSKEFEKEIKTTSDYANKLKDGLSSVGLRLVQMDEAGYLALMRRFFHLYNKDDSVTDEYKELREQVFGPGDVVDYDTEEIRFNDGEYYSKMLSVKHFPKNASIGLMNLLVGDPKGTSNQITEPYWMSATIHYPDPYKKLQQVRAKHMLVTQQASIGFARIIPALNYKRQGVDILVQELDGGGGTLCELNFTMTLFSRDRDKLNGLSTAWLAWAASYGYEMREDKRILKPLFHTVLPLGATTNGIYNLFRFSTMSVSHAIHFLPIIGNWHGSGSNASSILVSRRGTPVLFDPYDSETNFNGILAAESGAGKSFAAQQLLSDWLGSGARAWVIDQGRSYEKFCKANRGEFIEFSEESRICLNPFTNVRDIKEDMAMLKAIFAKMASPNEGLSEHMLAVLEEKIYLAYSKKVRKADVDLLASLCLDDTDQNVNKMGRMLYPFTRQGMFGRWFNGEANINLDKDLVVLELQDLANKKHLQQVVLVQLFASVGDAMFLTGKGRKKIFLIDEGWSLLKEPDMGAAIEAMYRKVRKEEGAAWLITQNIADLYEFSTGRAIISSSSWQIIMQQKSEAIDMAIKNGHMNIDVYTMNMLKSVHTIPGKYAEMMIRNGDNWGICRLITDRFSQILFSTKGWERDYVFEQIKAGRNVVEVIDQLVMEGK